MATDVFNPTISPEVQDQLVTATVEEIKASGNHGFSVFSTGDSDVDGALEGGKMALTSTATDRVVIFDTETNEPREILVNMLAKTLRKRRNGKPAFAMTPAGEFKQGQTLCWFHPDHPRRKDWDAAGLASFTCMSAHLASEFDAEVHAQSKHSRRYRVAKDYLERKEREDDRGRQDRLAEAMLASVRGSERKTHDCAECDRFFDSAQGLTLHRTKEHS